MKKKNAAAVDCVSYSKVHVWFRVFSTLTSAWHHRWWHRHWRCVENYTGCAHSWITHTQNRIVADSMPDCWYVQSCGSTGNNTTVYILIINSRLCYNNRHAHTGRVVHSTRTVKPPIGNRPMAKHTADTEQFPWSQHASLTYQRIQLRNNYLLGIKIWSRTRSLLEVFTVLVIDESQNVEKNH